MEQPCYKCGQIVEQGIPFCPHCAAPQIRVVIAEPPPILAVVADSETPPSDSSVSQAVAAVALPMRWSDAIKPCVLAAFIASVLMSLGLNPFVAMLSVGFLAIVFYRHYRPGILIKATAGAAIGALGGFLWFAISSIFGALIVIVLHKGPEIRQQLLDKIQQTATQAADAQVQATLERFKTPAGLEFLIGAGLVFALLASIVLASLGGALGGALLGRRPRS